MTTYYELSPAYGRDYKTANEVKSAFDAGNDFNGDYQLGFQLVNKEQLPEGSMVTLRYSKLRKIVVMPVKG